jgi:hypothetical protein
MIATLLDPHSRILIFLRDPIKRMVSEYVMRTRQHDSIKKSFVEPEEFFAALNLAPARKRTSPNDNSSYYSYAEMTDYAGLVKGYVDRFGVANVKVIIVELDLAQNLDATVPECFAFLELADADALKIVFTDNSQYADTSRMPSSINAEFICAYGSRRVNPAEIESLLKIGIDRIEITSDVPQQLDLTIDGPTEADAQSAATLAVRQAKRLTKEQERDLYNARFRDGVLQLEQMICRHRRAAIGTTAEQRADVAIQSESVTVAGANPLL